MKTLQPVFDDRTESVRVRSRIAREVLKRSVIAGEACTELGCDAQRTESTSWVKRLLRPQALRAGR